MSGALVRTMTGVKSSQDHISTAKEITELVNKVRGWYRSKTQWTVTVSSKDRLYDLAHAWFTDLTTKQSAAPRALEARYETKRYDELVYGGEESRSIQYYYDGTQERVVKIDGHMIRVSLHKKGASPKTNKQEPSFGDFMEPDLLMFYAKSLEGQRAVQRMLNALAVMQKDQKPCLWMLTKWGSWTRREDIPPRPLESVVLKKGQLERIRDDIQNFLDSEMDYVRRGIPWHRGILLEGEPGTGKTSTVAAIAAHLKLDLWYAPLGDLDKDTSLLNIIAEVRPRGILLLEDVDVFHAAREREDTSHKASMAALLNALDGVSTPHGMITILTTNNKSVIDDALIRPGRIDLIENISKPDHDQVRRLFKAFYNEPFVGTLPADPDKLLTTAAYMEIFKRHMNDPDAAVIEISY